jgi:hypothetical protein
MNKEFIPYTEALALKALGFDEPCFGYYVDGELRGINLGIEELGGIEPYYQIFGFHTLSNHNIDNQNKIVVTAPTYSQAFKWFRDKHNLYPSINIYNDKWLCVIKSTVSSENEVSGYIVDTINNGHPTFNTYEEAELACLENLIELVEQKEK